MISHQGNTYLMSSDSEYLAHFSYGTKPAEMAETISAAIAEFGRTASVAQCEVTPPFCFSPPGSGSPLPFPPRPSPPSTQNGHGSRPQSAHPAPPPPPTPLSPPTHS